MPKKVLVAEDDPDILKLVAVRLKASGYEVLTAPDGKEALRLIEVDKPDLAIIDLMLPEVNGWKICQRLKTDTRFRDIRVIMLSAMIEEEGEAEQLDQCDFLMSKPFNAEDLLAKVRELLEGSEQ